MEFRFLYKHIALMLAFILFASAGASVCVFAEEPQTPEATVVKQSQYENYSQKFTQIDISAVANRGFSDDVAGDYFGGWTDQGSVNDMSPFKLRGKNKFAGVEFNIIEPLDNNGKSAIMLRGVNDQQVPDKVEIAVNKTCAGIYFLHTSPFLDPKKAGELVGTYTIVYDDGSESSVDIINGVNTNNWWGSTSVSQYTVGWFGNNNSSEVNLGVFAMVNPYPEKNVAKLVLSTVGSGPYIAITGITLTDSGPYQMQLEEMDVGNPDISDWYAYEPCYYPEVISGTPLDISFLNDAPAGKHGFITAQGDNFIFEDGTRIKFWGTNLNNDIFDASYEELEQAATHISLMGINLVRFHGIQTFKMNAESLFQIDSTTRRTNDISRKSMDKWLYLLNELKKRGIYYWFDLPCKGITLDDNIQEVDSWIKSTMQGFPGHFDDDIRKSDLKTYAQIMQTYNPYTKCRIIDDPALVICQIYNESSILQTTSLDIPYYGEELERMYNVWLQEKYPSREALYDAWNDGSGKTGLGDEENQFDGTVLLGGLEERRLYGTTRRADNIEFLARVQADNYNERRSFLKSIGYKGLILGATDWTAEALGDVYANIAGGDINDTHIYRYLVGQGQKATPPGQISKPKSALETGTDSIEPFIANRKVKGVPLTISEWNASIPNPYAAENPLLMASYAALGNWNPLQFGWGPITYEKYQQRTIKEQRDLYTLNLIDQASLLYTMPAIGIIYKRDVKEAPEGWYYARYTEEESFLPAKQWTPFTTSVHMIGKTGYFFDDLEYNESDQSNRILKLKAEGDKTGRYVSVTGEMLTDINKKNFRLNTEGSQAACSYISEEPIELDDVIFDIDTEFASVYLNAISGDDITTADKLLLTTTARHKNYNQKMSKDATQFLSGAEGPILMEPVTGDVIIKTYDNISVYSLDFSGHRKEKLKITRTDEGFAKITLTKDLKAMNYEIVRNERAEKPYIPEHIVFGDTNPGSLFDDMSGYEWAETSVERMVLSGYITPTAEKKFTPYQTVTRGQFVSYIVAASKLATNATSIEFADVDDSCEYKNAIDTAASQGVIGGNGGYFRPDEKITVEDMLFILDKTITAAKKVRKNNPAVSTDNLKDLDSVSDYAMNSVIKMISQGYYDADNGIINPKAEVSRALAAVIIDRMLWK